MRHRHLDLPSGTPIGALGLAALDDLLERGDLADWQPLLAEIADDPTGSVADRVLRLVDAHPMQGTSPLLRGWIHARRANARVGAIGADLRGLRTRLGVTQQELGARLGMTQPEISRLERRQDMKLGVARSYVAALGGHLAVTARIGDESYELGKSEATANGEGVTPEG